MLSSIIAQPSQFPLTDGILQNFFTIILREKIYVIVIFGHAQTIWSILNQINMNSDRIPNFLAQ